MRPVLVAIWFIAVLAGATACTTSDGDAAQDTSTTTEASGPRSDPGTEIADGLIVPEGTTMAGSLFAPSAYSATGERVAPPDAWIAHLVVDGDGFAAYDDLAGQIRDLDPPAPVPGTADSCIWSLDEASSSSIDGPQDLLVRDRLHDGISGVRCESQASDGSGHRYGLSLVAGGDQAAVLEVTVTPAPEGPGEPDSYAQRILAEGQAGDPAPLETPGEAAVPAGAWADAGLDATAPPDPPASGPFGIPANCTASGQFTVPDGAEVLVDLFGDHLASLLAVDDVDAAMADLLDQTHGPDDPSVRSSLTTVTLDGGGSIEVLTSQVMAGGGSCTATSSPDGRAIRIDRYPD
ncbi:MAG: hypothetical protein KDA98_10120 [Acidimicrobiales bacterium]|nr:hypothetical protein [Acidimicrobiales bacterium]